MILTTLVCSLVRRSSQTLFKKWIKYQSRRRKGISTQEAKASTRLKLWKPPPAFSFLLTRRLVKDQLKSLVITVDRNRLASMLQVAKVGPKAMLVRLIRLRSANINPSTTRSRKSLSKPKLLHHVKIMEPTEYTSEKFSILFGATKSSETSTSRSPKYVPAKSVSLKMLQDTL